MQKGINREALRKMIPHGYLKIIAQKISVSERSISNYLTGRTKQSIKIENAILEELAQISKKRKALLKEIES